MKIERDLAAFLTWGPHFYSCLVVEKEDDLLSPLGFARVRRRNDTKPALLLQKVLRLAEKKANVTIDQLYLDMPIFHLTPVQSKVTLQGRYEMACDTKEKIALKMRQALTDRNYRIVHESVGDQISMGMNRGIIRPLCFLTIEQRRYDEFEQTVAQMGVELKGIRCSSYDAASYFSTEQEKKDGVVYVHLSEDCTSYCAFKNNLLCRTGRIPLGILDILRDLGKKGFSYQQAQELLKIYGCSESAIGTIVSNRLRQLTETLTEEFRPLEGTIGSALNWIVGGCEERIEGLIPFMQKLIHRSIRYGSSMKRNQFSDREIELLTMAHFIMGGNILPLNDTIPLDFLLDRHSRNFSSGNVLQEEKDKLCI